MEEWCPIAKVYDPLKAGSIDGTDSRPHDRGIERAMMAKYKPRKDELDGDPECTLFVGRLNPDTDEKSLYKAFQKFGQIITVKVIRDIVTGFSKCYGFVEFEKQKCALRAWQDAHEDVIDERVVFVDYEASRSMSGWIPRRLGGGFGGKKESGQLRFGGRDRPFMKPINLQRKGSYQSRDGRGYNDGKRYRDRYETDRYGDRRDRGRDRDRDRDRYRDRDKDKDRYEERDKYRDRDRYEDRDKYEDRDRYGDKDKYGDRDRERDSYRDRDHRDNERSRLKDRIKIEEDDDDDDRDCRKEKKGRY